jgi:hypothetical protein
VRSARLASSKVVYAHLQGPLPLVLLTTTRTGGKASEIQSRLTKQQHVPRHFHAYALAVRQQRMHRNAHTDLGEGIIAGLAAAAG